MYKIVVQPEIANKSSYNIKIYTQPMFLFAVLGHENKVIQSFFGALREMLALVYLFDNYGIETISNPERLKD